MGRLMLALLGALLVLGMGVFAQPSPLAQEIIKAMNQSVDPCSDFYMYACGGWIAANPLPPTSADEERAFGAIGVYNNQILQKILETTTNPKMKDMYVSCMNTTAINQRGSAPIVGWLERIRNKLDSLSDFMNELGILHSQGVPGLFSFTADLDAKNPGTVIAQFSQGGYALPDRLYYLDNSTDGQELLKQYVQHITKMFVLAGESQDMAQASAQLAFSFENSLAVASLPDDALLNPFATYNKLDLSGLQALTPAIPWQPYLYGIGAPALTQINVVTPAFFSAINQILPSTSTQELVAYLRWQIIHNAAPYLSDAFVNETFNFFQRILEGVQQPGPRQEFCISEVDATLGDLLGAAYAQIAFSGDSLQLASQMIQMIEGAMQENLQTLSWMDNITRAAALLKLSAVRNMIGYPPKPDNYSSLDLLPDSFFTNVNRASTYAFNKMVKSVGQPADPNAWQMTADTINAYYDPTTNEMVFPAGILQFPYFNSSDPDPMNFGGAGMIMGHELTHGFDPEGRFYNGSGYLVNWWQPATAAAFQQRADCIIAQYSGFEVLPGLYINGNQTQGENVADCGGIKNSYNAYLKHAGAAANQTSIVPGLSNIQLFFVGYAQGWCAVQSPEYLKLIVESDVHSPPRFRVLGPLMNLPQFSDVWKCPVGSPMNPTNRCEVW